MSPKNIVIISSGARTAVGLNAKSTAASVRAGISGFEEHPFLISRSGEPYTLAMAPAIDPQTTFRQRIIDMSKPALQEALDILNPLDIQIEIPVIIGLPEARPGLPDDLPALIEKWSLEFGTMPFTIKSVKLLPHGHSAGLMALEAGSQLVSSGKAEFCIVGGVDSYINSESLEWLESHEQLHHPDNAWGFIPGEAAGFCLICNKNTAHRFNLPIRAELLAISTANEKNRIKTETICLGQGLTQAVKEVAQSIPQGALIDYTICDQNGEAYRADEFGFMLTRLSDRFQDPSNYLAPADCWGDVGAASGPLFINQICAAAEKGYAKGPYTILWTSSEGGERTAVILKTEKRAES